MTSSTRKSDSLMYRGSLSTETVDKMILMRRVLLGAARCIEDLGASRELSLAFNGIEEALFQVNKHLVLTDASAVIIDPWQEKTSFEKLSDAEQAKVVADALKETVVHEAVEEEVKEHVVDHDVIDNSKSVETPADASVETPAAVGSEAPVSMQPQVTVVR